MSGSGGKGGGVMADGRVVKGGDCNVSCLDTSGYVTVENSRLASGYLFRSKKRQPPSGHEQYDNTRVYMKIYIDNCICNIRELVTYTF